MNSKILGIFTMKILYFRSDVGKCIKINRAHNNMKFIKSGFSATDNCCVSAFTNNFTEN